MRIHEITTIKPIQPLTPANARINVLKQAKAIAVVQKAQQTLAKVNME